MKATEVKGFNTALQQVDAQYSWINDMIRARQDLVTRYMQLLQHVSAATSDSKSAKKLLLEITEFCEHMIDYVSHGHFDLYPKIIELMENASGRSLSIAQRAMPRIEETTDILMNFNDTYIEGDLEPERGKLKDDLGSVAEALELRFRNEDRLIIGLRLVHSIMETPC